MWIVMFISLASQSRSGVFIPVVEAPSTAHFICIPYQTHPIHILQSLLMCWFQSGVFKDTYNMYSAGGLHDRCENPWAKPWCQLDTTHSLYLSSRTVKVQRLSLKLHRQPWASMSFGQRVLDLEMNLQMLVWYLRVWKLCKTCKVSHMDVWCFLDSCMHLTWITQRNSSAHLKCSRKSWWN